MNSYTFFSDKPKTDPKDDLLGYSNLAKNLASSIETMITVESITIGITGEWGSGKTTFLEFLLYYLKISESDEFKIIRFNPWWFSSHEGLVKSFFTGLITELKNWKSFKSKITSKISNYADYYIELELPGTSLAKGLSKFTKGKETSIIEQKRQIEDLLNKSEKKILIAIDDIDRLTTKEIQTIFTLIKTITDFPNILYITAFDKSVVTTALDEVQGISGEKYLEKIVQIIINLPEPEEPSIENIFFENLNKIISDTHDYLFDRIHWGNIYNEGIKPLLKNPRDVLRLTNSISVTFSLVKNEVNTADFIALETIRIFNPELYELIRRNPQFFSGAMESRNDYSLNFESFKLFHEKWINSVNEDVREHYKRMITRLFPKLESIFRNTFYSNSHLKIWRRTSRIAHPESFKIYFKLTIPSNQIGNLEMQSALKLVSDQEIFSKLLLEYSEIKLPNHNYKIQLFLSKFQDFLDDSEVIDNSENIIYSFFNAGKKIIESDKKTPGMYYIDNKHKIRYIIYKLLEKKEITERIAILKKCIQETEDFSLIGYLLLNLGYLNGKYKYENVNSEPNPLIPIERFNEIEEIGFNRFKSIQNDEILLNSPLLLSIIHWWSYLTENLEITEWLKEKIDSLKFLVRILESSINEGYSQVLTDVVGRVRKKLDLTWLKRYLSEEEINKVLINLKNQTEVELSKELDFLISSYLNNRNDEEYEN